MPLDIQTNADIPKVNMLTSATIEVIAAIELLADIRHHEFAREWADKTISNLSDKSIKTLEVLRSITSKISGLFEFILEYRVFNDVEALCQLILECERMEFIYKFFSEEISKEDIKLLINDKKKLSDIIDDIAWLINGDDSGIKYVLYKTDDFKKDISNLMQELYTEDFIEQLKTLESLYSQSMEVISKKLTDRNPLDLCQEIMGKKFRRISNYKEYIFVPSYFISPHQIRIFNQEALLLVFDIRRDTYNNNERVENVSKALSIISDRTRLQILKQLIVGPAYGKLLARRLDLTTATISHHLDQLKSINLVTEERVKNIKYFKANIGEVDKLLGEMKKYLFNE